MLIPLGVVLCMFGIVGRRVSIPQILSIILLKYFYSISIRAISASKTVRFATPNGIFCKPFDSQRVTRLLKANFHSEFYLHRQSLLFVFFTVLFFLSSSLLSPIILFSTLILFPSTVPEFVHLRIPSTPSPSADPTSPASLFLLFVLSIPPPRLLYFSSLSSLFLLFVLSVPLPATSVSLLIIIYFLLNFPLSLFLLS